MNKMNDFFKKMDKNTILQVIIILLLVIILADRVITSFAGNKEGKKDDLNVVKEGMVTENNVIPEEPKITNEELRDDLSGIEQMDYYIQDYSDVVVVEKMKNILGKERKITKHTINIVYSGTVKSYYGISILQTAVIDNDNKTITFAYPEKPFVTVTTGEVETIEDDNWLNPIKENEVNDQLEIEKQKQLEKAINEGLYEKTKDYYREFIEEYLNTYGDKYEEYEVL